MLSNTALQEEDKDALARAAKQLSTSPDIFI